jgi:hypothetical protein
VVPYVGVTRGAAGVWAEGRPGTSVEIDLKDGLTVLSVFAGTMSTTGFSGGSFIDADGGAVYPHTGNTIQALGLASDVDFEVPAVTVGGNATTDVVSGTCGVSTVGYQFWVYRPSGSPFATPARIARPIDDPPRLNVSAYAAAYSTQAAAPATMSGTRPGPASRNTGAAATRASANDRGALSGDIVGVD